MTIDRFIVTRGPSAWDAGAAWNVKDQPENTRSQKLLKVLLENMVHEVRRDPWPMWKVTKVIPGC
jgi:hypothetical protein